MENKRETTKKLDPKVKDVLRMVALGSIVTASFLMPGLPLLAKPILDDMREEEASEWKKFNSWRLKQILKRLHEQKMVDIVETASVTTVKVTTKGRRKLLKYNLDDIKLIHKRWDGKWRIIAYDVDESKKSFRRAFQVILKKLEFLQLQQSVYLTPYPCENEIEFLRQIHDIGSEVTILTVSGLENEQAYKDYYGLR